MGPIEPKGPRVVRVDVIDAYARGVDGMLRNEMAPNAIFAASKPKPKPQQKPKPGYGQGGWGQP